MEELFTILSSSARLDKSKQKRKRQRVVVDEQGSDSSDDDSEKDENRIFSRDRTGKRDKSDEKLKQVHKEQVAAFRRSMAIRVANKHDPDLSDPLPSFKEMKAPTWWNIGDTFRRISLAIQNNIESGRWKEPTPS